MMRRLFYSLVVPVALAGWVTGGCAQATPAPTKAPTAASSAAAAPTKAAEPTKSAAPATAVSQPTAVPAKKVDFPQKDKPITILCGVEAGSATDVSTRLLIPSMEKQLGVNVLVENKPGANSQIALTEQSKRPADGYTIGTMNFPTSLVTYLLADRKASYGRKDFQPLARHIVDGMGLAVRADSPYKTMKDLVDAAKAKPGQIKVSISQALSDNHMALLLLQKKAGVDFATAPMGSLPTTLPALLGGHIEAIAANAGNFVAPSKSGQVRVLGVMAESKYLPGVKTFASQGYDITFVGGRGFVLRAGTPREIVDVLAGTLKKAMEDADVKKKMDELGFDQAYLGPDEMADWWTQNEVLTNQILAEAAPKK